MACKAFPDALPGKDGELKTPILFMDLMKATNGNSKLASTIYYMVDESFKSKYAGELAFDEQGMPTYSSLMKIPAIKRVFDLSTDTVIANLSKHFNTGVFEFQEAAERMGAFNNNPSFRGTYLGTISKIKTGKDKGKYRFSIVENTTKNRRTLESTLEQETFYNRLIGALAQAGVKTTFVDEILENDNSVEGVYSTINPKTMYDNLYELIKVINDPREGKRLSILKEETGHLIVGIAENSDRSKVLFDRLINSLKSASDPMLKNILVELGKYTEEQAESIIRDIATDEEPAREAAGRVLGMMLTHQNVGTTSINNTFLYKLFNRTANALSRVFHYITRAMIESSIDILNKINPKKNFFETVIKTLEAAYNSTNDTFNLTDLNLRDDIIREARMLTDKFLGGTLGTAQEAMMTEEERHHESSLAGRTAQQLIDAFSVFIKQSKTLGLSKKEELALKEYIANASTAGRAFSGTVGKYYVVANMLNSMAALISDYTDNVWRAVVDADYTERLKDGTFMMVPDLNAKIEGISRMLALLKMGKNAAAITKELLSSNDAQVMEHDLYGKLDTIKQLVEAVDDSVHLVNKQIFKATLSTINGGHEYIMRTERMGWGKKIDGRKLTFDELIAGVSDASGEVEEIVEDASFWDTWMRSMGRNKGIINQLASNLYDFNCAEANKDMYRYSQILLELHERIQKTLKKEDTTFFLEMDDNGVPTGNIVQPEVNYGKWEQDYQDQLSKWRAEWRKLQRDYAASHNDEPQFFNQFDEGRAWFEWMLPKYTEWHENNSEAIDPDAPRSELYNENNPFEEHGIGTRYKPKKSKYASDAWEKLSDEQRSFIREYIAIKQSLDEFIESYHPHSVTTYRLPQFRGTFISRMGIKNAYKETIDPETGEVTRSVDWHTRIGRNIGESFQRNFFLDALDEDFGDQTCYSHEEDSFFDMSRLSDRELARKVPVYGVNKISDLHNLSRDVIYSTMQYAAMALNVRGLSTTAMVLQNGLEVINETTIKGLRENNRASHSNIYTRYTKFLEMQVFGQKSRLCPIKSTNKETKKTRIFLINKLSDNINRIGSWMLLAGKLASGTVNTGTGAIQLLKEGAVGEHFTSKELARAKKEYWKAFGLRKFHNGEFHGLKPLNAEIKWDTFIRYMDSINENDAYYRDFESHKRLNPISQLRTLDWAMWVYSSGNDYIQSIPYCAKAIHTKMYKLKEGVEPTTENLLDEDNFEESGNVWDNFNYEDFNRTQEAVDSRGNKVKETNTKMVLINEEDADLTERYKDWGDPYRTEDGNPYYIRNADGSFVEWNRVTQSTFQTKCRYMTDNMHGIYNSKDAVAFSQMWWGSAVLTMKKYLLGYMDKLYMSDRYSVAEGHDLEGAVNSFAKLNYYLTHKKSLENENNMQSWLRVIGMASPVLLSVASGIMKCSTLATLFDLFYFPMYRILYKSDKIGKGETKLRNAGFSEQQVNAIRRFDSEMKVGIALRMITRLLSPSLFATGAADDDDWDEDELPLGTKLDSKVMELIGYDDYIEDLRGEVTKGKKKDTLRKNAKIPGLGYTYVKNQVDNWFVPYMCMAAYYYTHRWELEQSTLFPYDLRWESSNTFIDDLGVQSGAYSNIFPVGMSAMFSVGEAIVNFGTTNYSPTYNYDDSAYTFEEIFDNYDKYDEEGIAKIMKLFRTIEYKMTFGNKGLDKLWQMQPYFNSAGPVEDPEKGAKAYDFGRTKN